MREKGNTLIRACFVMEQHLGHRAFYHSLRPQVDADPRLRADWVEITYWQADGMLERARWLPQGLRDSLCGMQQVRRGLGQASYDVAVHNTQVPAAWSIWPSMQRPEEMKKADEL